jgi:membrane protein YdbS with pleckstrin-like domain
VVNSGLAVERRFGVDHELIRLYHVYLVSILFGGFLWWMIPIVYFAWISWWVIGLIVTCLFLVPVLVAVLVALYWIPKFRSSITYSLEEDKIVVSKGVWWKTRSFVPYNRVTNINIYQGPLSRHFGLGKLSIQTAGFSGATSSGGKTAEAVVFGIKNFEEVKDAVMECVTGTKPQAVEAETEDKPRRNVDQQILEELQRIRKGLEK